MTFPITENRFRWLVAATVCVGAFLAYGNSLTGEFVWDDVSSVLLHKHVQDPSQIAQLFREDLHAFGRGQGSFYRPLLACSFMLDFALSKGPTTAEQAQEKIPKVSPLLFHLSNIAWHAGAALLFLALLTRIGAPRFVRAVVPIVFVLHPLHTEAVTYISGRGDPMAATLLFAGLWFALLEGPWRRQMLGVAGSGICFVAALLTKESAAIFPVLLLVLSLVAPRKVLVSGETQDVSARHVPPSFVANRLVPLILSVVILAVYACLRMTWLHFGADAASRVTTFAQRAIEACQAFTLYMGLVVAPTGLHMERTLNGAPLWAGGLGAFLLLVCIGFIALGVRRGHGRAAAGMAWFVAAWFPISGFIPLNAPMAEHWMYVPLAGLLWAIAESLSPAMASQIGLRMATVAAYGLCVWFTALTVARNSDWHSNESLFVATLQKNPKSLRVHHNLAVTYQDMLHNMPGARRHFEQVIELAKERKMGNAHDGTETFSDEEIESHISLGEIFTQQQDYRQAAGHFGEILQLKKDDHTAPYIGAAAFGMGQCFLAIGQVDQARRQFDVAVAARPELKESVDRLLRAVPQALPGAS